MIFGVPAAIARPVGPFQSSAFRILTDPQHLFAVCLVPFQSVRSSNEGSGEIPGGAIRIGIAGRPVITGIRGSGDEMSRLGIAICALFMLVFTGGLNPEPRHEGLLLLSLTLLIYMAAFSSTKKKQKS